MAKGLLDILADKIIDSIFTSKVTGKLGEVLTEKELLYVKLFGRKGKILRNVYLPKDNGETSEVDVIFITHKGIFVFESKNYSGWIFGDERSKYWTAMLPNKIKNQFYNPVMQNRTHLKWMKEFVGEDIPLFSIIVFSERCELKKVTIYSDDVKVIKRDRTYATVRDFWDESPDMVSDERIEELYAKLKERTKVDKATKAAHVENIEKKYKSSDHPKNKSVEQDDIKASSPADSKEESSTVNNEEAPVTVTITNKTEEEPSEMICPKCGSKLVLRTARKGGNKFYGCSAYPKCRYVKNV